MKIIGKSKIVACLLAMVMLVGLLPTTSFAGTEPPSGIYKKDGWAYTWDANTKRLEISDNTAKLEAATPIESIQSLKDDAITVAFVDIKIPNGYDPLTPSVKGFRVIDYLGKKTRDLDMSKANTSGVTSMYEMFCGCASLNSINVTGLDTSNVTNMTALFEACTSLTYIEGLNTLDTSKVEEMPGIFQNVPVYNLDLSGVQIKPGCFLSNAFSGCDYLKTLNLSGVDLSQATGEDLLKDCTSLKRIDTPKGISADLDGLPYDMYEDDPNDPLAMTTPYKDKIPSNKTLWLKYAVTYMDTDPKREIAKQNVKYGENADPNRIETAKPGFVFDKWVDENGNPAVLTNITAPKTVYARYVAAATASVTCPELNGIKDTAITPVQPTREGCVDGGTWSAGGLPAGLSIAPVSGKITGTPTTAGTGIFTVTYTAPDEKATTSPSIRYNIVDPGQYFTITFKVVNGSWADGTVADKTVKVKAGNKLLAADVPTGMKADSGYTTGQWNTQLDTTSAITADATYTYTFDHSGGVPGGGVTNYTLTYNTNGGTSIPAESYASGKDVMLTKTPSRAGYTFIGWYSDTACTNRITKVTMNSNMTVYAGWNKTAAPPSEFNSKDHFAYIMGYEDGMVHPNANITRAQTATALYRLLTTDKRNAIFTSGNNFSDVSSKLWYNKAVSSMAKGGYIKGYADGTFDGDKNITRAEFVTMVVRFLGADASATCSFNDVSRNYWAYSYIATATKAGWISGYSDGSFKPDKNITRAEAMTILNRILNRGVDKTSNITGFKVWADNQADSWYYYEVIEATNDHEYTGARPSENWTKLTVDYQYDINYYEKP